jgi:hypothetical protein
MKKAILAVLVLSSTAYAQDCSSGTCNRPVRSTVQAVASPVVQVAETAVGFAAGVTQEVACATRNVVQTAGCVANRTVSSAVTTVKRPLLRSRRCCR